MSGIVIFAAAIALIAGIGISAHLGQKKRTANLQEAANALGLIFHPTGEAGVQRECDEFELMRKGRGRTYRNLVIAQTDDVKISIFDYEYTTGSGKSRATHVQSVAAITSPQLRMPAFRARPEGFFDGIGSSLGFQDIDFDEHPEFSKAFVLKSKQEDQTRLFFDLPLLDHFAARPKLSFEAVAGSFMFYRPRVKTKPEELKSSLEESYRFFHALRDRHNRKAD